jgi:hypothetical protein
MFAAACGSGSDSDGESSVSTASSGSTSQLEETAVSSSPSVLTATSDSGTAEVATEVPATPVESEATVPAQKVEADLAAAEAALLALSDFPAGWSETPYTDESDEELSRRQVECLGGEGDTLFDNEAKARTGDFANPDDDQEINETVSVGASEAEAVAILAGFEDDSAITCLTEVYNDRFRELLEDELDDDGEVGEISVARLNVTPVGDELHALRIQVPVETELITVDFSFDIVGVRVGRSLAGLFFASQFGPTPIEQIDKYTALAASRLPA